VRAHPAEEGCGFKDRPQPSERIWLCSSLTVASSSRKARCHDAQRLSTALTASRTPEGDGGGGNSEGKKVAIGEGRLGEA
jgi:hypothetical protein